MPKIAKTATRAARKIRLAAASALSSGSVSAVLPTEPQSDVAAIVPVSPAPAAKPVRVARTAATILRQAANYGGSLSDRDLAYFTFYAGFAKRSADGSVTLADIVASGARPVYSPSNKPHDAGAIIRLAKAGLLLPNGDGTGFTFSDTAKTHSAYAKATA